MYDNFFVEMAGGFRILSNVQIPPTSHGRLFGAKGPKSGGARERSQFRTVLALQSFLECTYEEGACKHEGCLHRFLVGILGEDAVVPASVWVSCNLQHYIVPRIVIYISPECFGGGGGSSAPTWTLV